MEPASLTLTRDELLAFLAIMGASTINGLGDDPLAGLSEAEIETRLNSGEQSLLNRGLIEPQGADNVALDDALVALVGGAVIPEATFLLTQTQPDGLTDPHYFDATPELLVEHYSPRAGIYMFNHLPDPQSLVYRVETLLAPLHPLTDGRGRFARSVSAAAMTQFLESSRKGDRDAAELALTTDGCPADMAAALAGECATLPSWIGVVAWGLREEQPAGGNSLMAIMGQDGCWLVENVPDQSEQVKVRSASGRECEAAFVAMLQPLSQTLDHTQ